MNIYGAVVGEFQTNCYVVASQEKNAVVIDAGNEAEKIASIIEEHGLNIKYFLLTHAHFDHIMAVNELKARFGGQVVICKDDNFMIKEPKSIYTGNYMPVTPKITVNADILLSDGDTITVDELTFKAIHTPGHTPGSMCFVCGDNIFTGDTLFAGSIGRTDLFGGDYKVLHNSLEKLKVLDDNLRVFPGHGETSTLKTEKAENPFMLSEEDYDSIY